MQIQKKTIECYPINFEYCLKLVFPLIVRKKCFLYQSIFNPPPFSFFHNSPPSSFLYVCLSISLYSYEMPSLLHSSLPPPFSTLHSSLPLLHSIIHFTLSLSVCLSISLCSSLSLNRYVYLHVCLYVTACLCVSLFLFIASYIPYFSYIHKLKKMAMTNMFVLSRSTTIHAQSLISTCLQASRYLILYLCSLVPSFI